MEDIKKEKETLQQELQQLEQRKNEIITRLIEIQGIEKYLNSKEK